MEMECDPPPLLALPAEIIQHILSFLAPSALAHISAVNRSFNDQARAEHLWAPHVNANLPEPIHSPAPLSSFRELYIAHHPYWFIPRHRLWISDADPSGKLLLARYDPVRACIEAHAVTAERGSHTFELWSHDRNVAIHSFNPCITLDLHQPVLRLSPASPRAEINSSPSRRARGGVFGLRGAVDSSDSDEQDATPRLSQEIMMDTSAPSGLCTTFLLSRDYPAALIGPQTAVWPPVEIPAPSRTRNSSAGGFSSSGHRPTKNSEVSQNTFRLRKWVEFHGRRGSSSLARFAGLEQLSHVLGYAAQQSGPTMNVGSGMSIRMGEEVSTFGTILPEAYTPTPSKPWRGIWCGDYSGHGCEFLALLQPNAGAETPLPDGMHWMKEWLETGRRGSESSWNSYSSAHADIREVLANLASQEQEDLNIEEADEEDDEWDTLAVPGELGPQRETTEAIDMDEDGRDAHSGQLFAMKLTGDPNIPRGQYTFIAPNIGDKGLVRTATEDVFRGARVVRSAGHIAGRGFRNGKSISLTTRRTMLTNVSQTSTCLLS